MLDGAVDLRLDPQGDWYFNLTRALSKRVRAHLWTIPGVHDVSFGSAPQIKTSYDAGITVDALLRQLGAKPDEDYTRRGGWQGPSVAQRAAHAHAVLAQSTELQPEVWQRTFGYQQATVVRAAELGSAQVWVDPGGGKTLIGLEYALTAPGPVVVVTRAATREHHAREILKWTRLTPCTIETRGRQTLEDYLSWCRSRGQRPITIIGWEALPRWVYAKGTNSPVGPIIQLLAQGGCVIFDEAHKAKSHARTEQSVGRNGERVYHDLCNVVAAAAHMARAASRRLLTTATPIYNTLSDLWGQCDICHPGRMSGFWRFARYFCGAYQGQHSYVPDAATGYHLLPHTGELKRRLRLSAIRVPYSVSHGNLPPKRRYVDRLGPTDVRRPDGGFAREMKAAIKERNRGKLVELKLNEAASMKRPWIKSRTEDYLHSRDNHGKVVVLTGRNREVDALGVSLRQLALLKLPTDHDPRQLGDGKAPWLWVAHGPSENSDWGTSTQQRDLIAQRFLHHPGPCVLVGGDTALGEGVDLQDADALIVGKMPYEPGKVHQIEHRVCRIGQKRPVDILYPLVVGTYDEACASIVVAKLPAVEDVGESEELRGMTEQVRGLGDMEGLLDAVERFVEGLEMELELED